MLLFGSAALAAVKSSFLNAIYGCVISSTFHHKPSLVLNSQPLPWEILKYVDETDTIKRSEMLLEDILNLYLGEINVPTEIFGVTLFGSNKQAMLTFWV